MRAPVDVLEVFLQPGEFYFGEDRTRISTLLGSCVSLALWHPTLHIGGMCHYLLPTAPAKAAGGQLDGRYGEHAIQMFLREMGNAGTRPSEYELKIFGGGSMLQTDVRSGGINVSQRNIEFAHTLVKQHRFRLKGEDLGGEKHRFIMLDLWSGNVWVRRGPGVAGQRPPMEA